MGVVEWSRRLGRLSRRAAGEALRWCLSLALTPRCAFGLHWWKYRSELYPVERYCLRCWRNQVWSWDRRRWLWK